MTLAHNMDNVEVFQTKCGKAIEQFLRDKGKSSERTQANYRSSIEKFLHDVYKRTINTITVEELDKLEYETLTDYIDSLRNKEKDNNSTVNRHTSSIRSLIKYLKGRDILKNEIDYLSIINLLPKNSKRVDHMPREVVMDYIKEAGKELHSSKAKQLMIMLAVDTALRLEDYTEMKWSQFTPQENYVALRGYGKGNKPYIEKISYEVYNELLELKESQDSEETKVFAPLNEKNITDMMSKFKLRLGYKDRAYSFHSFKKVGVLFTYRLTGDILEAMKKGKHSNMETTRIYLEEEDYGVTGMFSLGDHDPDLYKKVNQDELLAALGEMNKDTLHLLNIKIKNIQDKRMNSENT